MTPSEFALNFKYAFNIKKPILTSRLVGAVLKSKVLKRPPLRFVDFAIDYPCNLKCEHCFATALQRPKTKKMGVDDYERVAYESMQLGCVNFSFQGGEPLLFKHLGDVISACKPQKNVISVTTNGTLLTDEKIEELKATGVDILTISLDSGIAEEHDKFRGVAGSFDKTINAIQRALNSGFKVTIGSVVTHDNLNSEGMSKLISMAKEWKVLLYLILPVNAGRWTQTDDISLTPDDLKQVYKVTEESYYIRTDFQSNLGGHGCGALKEILYITAYGDVLPCPFMHISFGNIFKDSIKNIREQGLKLKPFATYHDKCLVSTDQNFVDNYLSKTFETEDLPLIWHDVFPESEIIKK